jgi:hypothetical protein
MGRTGVSIEGDEGTFEKSMSIVEGVREGVKVETKYDVGPMMRFMEGR